MKKLFLSSLIIAIAGFALARLVFASVSSYTASGFSQFCSSNSTTCSKNEHPGDRSGSVSCPSSSQTIDKVYIHAGGGQTVYELPDSGLSETFSNNNNKVTVGALNGSHDLSWIAVVCSVHQNPTPTPSHKACINNACIVVDGAGDNTCNINDDCISNQTHNECQNNACVVVSGAGSNVCSVDSDCASNLTPTPTETLTPTPTPICPDGEVLDPGLHICISCPGGGTCEVIIGGTPTPTLTPVPTETPVPTATPTPTPESNNNSGGNSNPGGPGDGLSDGRSDGGSSSPAKQGEVLGASTFAGTGTFDSTLATIEQGAGILSFLGGTILYGKKKAKKETK